MKRHLVLEYRIRKLEKAILEDMDSDLDKMSDDILKGMPNDDLDAELDKKATDIVDKEPGYFYKADPFGDRVKTYDTIEDWLDDKTIEIQLNTARPHKGDVVKDLNLAIKQLTHVVDGLNYVRRLKNYIKEISDMNVLKAQQKLVSALRKRIKEAEKSNSDSKKAKDIASTHYRTINDWIDSIAFNNEVEAEDKVTGLKYAIMHLKGMLDDQTSARLKEGGLDFGLHRAAEIKNNIEELRNTNVLIANQKMVSALRKKIKELESELKGIKNRKSLESLTYEGKQDQEILNDFLGDDYYNKYQVIKNRISDPDYKDIYKLIKKDPDEVKEYIDNFKSSRDKRATSKGMGARKVYEDSDWIVYHITNYNAAKYYGKDTKWCLSGNYEGLEEVGQHEFEKYNSKNNIYFYINKHKTREKYAVLKNRYTDRITDVYDSADNNLGNSAYYINVELPYVEEVGYNTASQLELYDAIKEGDLDQVKDCFSKDFVNMKDHRGVTPLMIAIMRSFEDIAEFLIKNGANVNAQNNAGATPLMYACFENNLDMVKLLVKYGADVNAKTKYGTPFTSTDDEDIEEYLISKGAKID